jgi:hypothetical protein
VSIYRRAAKSDIARAEIVEGLRAHGVCVWDVRRPADILCWHSRFGPGAFRVLEIKTAYGKRNPKPRIDKRQKAQNDFLALTGTPVVTDLQSALVSLGLHPPPTSARSTFQPHLASTVSVGAR